MSPLLKVVLVRTEYPGNIGASARAMANMGVDQLILLDPQSDPTATRAKQGAAGAQHVLSQHQLYRSWDDFYKNEGEGIRIGLTRRGGKNRKVLNLEEFLQKLKKSKKAQGQPVYFIFGPEADGLDSTDLSFVNEACHLPVYGDFASYNLSQAVLLTLHIARQIFPPEEMLSQIKGGQRESVAPFYFPDEAIREWLTAMGFDINARRSSAYLTLKRLFLQNLPTRHDLQVLEAILQQNIRKLKSRDK